MYYMYIHTFEAIILYLQVIIHPRLFVYHTLVHLQASVSARAATARIDADNTAATLIGALTVMFRNCMLINKDNLML